MRAGIITLTICFIYSTSLFAVRPFITDDARVVGFRLAQWETWMRFDRPSFEMWHLFAYGPHKNIELTFGGLGGIEALENGTRQFAAGGPLLQGKFLLHEYKPNKAPGVAVSVGTILPFGRGDFKPEGYGTFGFLALSQCFFEGEKLLLHANVGYNYLRVKKENDIQLTWGFGTQIHLFSGFHFVGEVISGDPYVAGSGEAWQMGFRHFISDFVQIDMTIGKGFGGSNPLPLWTSMGARMVTDFFYRKKQSRQKFS